MKLADVINAILQLTYAEKRTLIIILTRITEDYEGRVMNDIIDGLDENTKELLDDAGGT